MKKRFTEQQIVAILKEGEAGVAAKEICPAPLNLIQI